jgi:hypothetical protein
MLGGVPDTDLSSHSAYSDPLGHAALLDAVPTELGALSTVARNLIVHYRASGHELPAASRCDIHSRWLSAILDVDQKRHGIPLAQPREEPARVQGCCRDHSLFCVGVLRQHHIAARTRVGFAGYLGERGYYHDHVVVETRRDRRWVRFDPEMAGPLNDLTTPMDMPTGPDSSFLTAAEVWQGYRAGRLDPDHFGTGPGSEFGGPWFIRNYVVLEVAHRHGDELLLWDGWGAMSMPTAAPDGDDVAVIDEVAALLVAADQDPAAERELADRYAADDRLHPGTHVRRYSPFGEPPVIEQVGPRTSG